jgi:ATP-binding cassette subfamily B protein
MRLQEIDYNAKNKSADLLYDNLKNLALIKYTCQEQKEIMYYNRIEDRRYSFKQKTLNIRFYVTLLECSLVGLGTILSTILSIIDIKSGILSFGDFILINIYISQFFSPLKHLGLICLSFQKYISSFDRILTIIETSQADLFGKTLRQLVITNPIIKFQEVFFSYNQNVFALKSLTLIIMPKKFTAIVGRSGSGKSTITKLLTKLYDLDRGSITIDDQDIRYFGPQELVKHISITPQDSLLFDRTILYNIKYANSNASFTKVCDICKRIGLHDVIMSLPNQYDTIVGKAGLSFSGGQRQLLCIARALVQDVDIYVFDEVTSYLDGITEEKVLKEIKNILQYKTVIFISHRLTKIKEADHILVMDSGKLVEEGTHKDLLLKNGYYKQLWQDYSKI